MLKQWNKEFDEKTEKYDQLKEEMNILKSKQLALRERINALTAMEELFEGYSKSVGFIMNSYKNGEINGAKKVYGPISTLISVSDEYITAIETALPIPRITTTNKLTMVLTIGKTVVAIASFLAKKKTITVC